jgi:hypothetical protein
MSVLPWFALLSITLAVTCPAKASGPFDGDWTFKYSCDSATGPYAERCLRGEGDSFSLYGLTQNGGRICGYHVATAYGQNKVDEGDLDGKGPSIYGTVTGNVATVQFRSAWTGAIGVATITLRNDSIVWHVVKRIDQQNWFPDDAALSRSISDVPYVPTTCAVAQMNPDQ